MRSTLVPGLVLVAVLLVGCTGGDDPSPEPSGTGSSAEQDDSSGSWTAAELARVTLDVDPEEGSVLAEVEGALRQRIGEDLPARIAVTEVSAGDQGTTLRFVVRSTDGSEIGNVQPDAFSWVNPGFFDIRELALLDQSAGTRLQPYLGTQDPEKPLETCICSGHPSTIAASGIELSAVFPPLDPSTTDVTLEFPGFPTLDDVPVTRR